MHGAEESPLGRQIASGPRRDGLRLFEERKKALRRVSPQTTEELEEMLEVGIKELDSGNGIPRGCRPEGPATTRRFPPSWP